mmetsp:Transcript_27708/g.59214  ORF Transcript_27708/g.59214 Transcript_27708/m.59214 type:complete len:223 (-) Transcript_27708:364-1032(-)
MAISPYCDQIAVTVLDENSVGMLLVTHYILSNPVSKRTSQQSSKHQNKIPDLSSHSFLILSSRSSKREGILSPIPFSFGTIALSKPPSETKPPPLFVVWYSVTAARAVACVVALVGSVPLNSVKPRLCCVPQISPLDATVPGFPEPRAGTFSDNGLGFFPTALERKDVAAAPSLFLLLPLSFATPIDRPSRGVFPRSMECCHWLPDARRRREASSEAWLDPS